MAKKKKKAKKAVQEPLDDSKMFDSKTLKCLVCQNVVKEFEAAIFKVDPKKVIDTGTWRVNEGGEQKRQIVSVSFKNRSQCVKITQKSLTFPFTIFRTKPDTYV